MYHWITVRRFSFGFFSSDSPSFWGTGEITGLWGKPSSGQKLNMNLVQSWGFPSLAIAYPCVLCIHWRFWASLEPSSSRSGRMSSSSSSSSASKLRQKSYGDAAYTHHAIISTCSFWSVIGVPVCATLACKPTRSSDQTVGGERRVILLNQDNMKVWPYGLWIALRVKHWLVLRQPGPSVPDWG